MCLPDLHIKISKIIIVGFVYELTFLCYVFSDQRGRDYPFFQILIVQSGCDTNMTS